MNALELKVALQSRGLKVAESQADGPAGGPEPGSERGRAGGAGPSDALTVFIDGLAATVPVGAPYVRRSPYSLRRRTADRSWAVFDGEAELADCRLAPTPRFYRQSNANGVPFPAIALRHGRDAIGSTVVQACGHGPMSCRFCAISSSAASGATVPVKEPEDLAAVALAAEAEGYGHVVLTTGSTGSDAGIVRLAACSRAIRGRTGMRIHVQFEPPDDLGLIAEGAGAADSVAINIESFDERTLARMAPAKARAGLAGYRRAWSRAVEAFGPGQVTSFLIIGLGETEESLIRGAAELASIGVFPFLLPLRPLPGTPLESWSPPGEPAVMRVYEKAHRVVEREGLDPSDCLAGCVRCGACTGFTDMF